ncbi:MAG: acyl-CoA/acyl-ACP dehydrogenase [Betaproteobacteria bacterium]|nr:acyl-CoA/acyl-ACP dehydrogenase [Betaproteobacteria bacterium]
MDVLLNEDEAMLRSTTREFLDAECPPSLVRKMEQDARGYPESLWQKIAGLGWQGMALPEKHGGLDLPLVQLGLILEEVGRAVAPLPLHSTVVAALTIARDGSEAQREAILPDVVKGQTILTWAFTEQDPRLLPETVHTQAVADGNDFVINGTKLFVDNFVAADRCLVACRTAPASPANAGLSLFLVDTKSPGISHTPLVTLAKDKQGEVVFRDVRTPRSNLIGELNQGAPIIERMLDRATALLCAQMLGATRKDAEMAIASHLRRHDHLDRWRQPAHVRSAVENGSGPAGQRRGFPGEGVLQRKVRSGGALFADYPRRHRLHDGARSAPVVPARFRMDHAVGDHLRASCPDRARSAGLPGARGSGKAGARRSGSVSRGGEHDGPMSSVRQEHR